MNTRLKGKGFLTQIATLAAFPDFCTEASKDRSCARHAQDWRLGQDSV
jgi:hypothetical protein